MRIEKLSERITNERTILAYSYLNQNEPNNQRGPLKDFLIVVFRTSLIALTSNLHQNSKLVVYIPNKISGCSKYDQPKILSQAKSKSFD